MIMQADAIIKEKEIIESRFGLKSGKKVTLKKLSKKYNISTETIRLIEKQSLTKIKESFPELHIFLRN